MRLVGGLGRQDQLGDEVISISRGRLPRLEIVTRRTSASSSAETSAWKRVANARSRRENSTRSSLNVTSYAMGSVPTDWYAADHTSPLATSLRKTKEPQSSQVASSRQRVTARSRQVLYPDPAAVSITV